MSCSLSKRGGRSVALQFAHMHNDRAGTWRTGARDLSRDLVVFRPEIAPSREEFKEALIASGSAVETCLAVVPGGAAKRRGFKKGVFSTPAHFVTHESHHRGSILLTLNECGEGLDQKVRDAIGDWDRI